MTPFLPAQPTVLALTGAERATCTDHPSWVCLNTYRLTHDAGVAKAVDAAAVPIEVVLILVGAYIVRVLLTRAITRVVTRAATGGPATRRWGRGLPALPMTERRAQRARTIGSILRSVTSVFVYGIALLEVLAVLGLDIGPVLASAGIIGVAVGFGAQNLVRDFISGLFMVLEDQYGVGDVIDVGPASGVVEAISLRVTRLRDVHGVVWHVPNGSIERTGNMSMGWSRALLDVPVAYAQSIPHARTVIKRVADDVWHDPAFSAVVLEEPEVWGVEQFGDDSVVIRLVVKTAPLKQWEVARELRQRLKDAFDREGIEIPFPQRSVWIRTTGDVQPDPGLPVSGDGR